MSTKKRERKYPRVYTPIGGPSLTKQSFRDECNINKIMAKFQKTGAINHYSKFAEEYGDTTAPMLHEAQNIIADANSMFEELPSAIRKKFENEPGKFLEFVQNEDNLEEMRELGLANHAIPTPEKQSDTRVKGVDKTEAESSIEDS